MKKRSIFSFLLILVTTLVINVSFSKKLQAVESCSEVVNVGTCWSGFYALVADMANGDKLYLGRLDNSGGNPYEAANTKARLALAITAKATGEQVCYQSINPAAICAVVRGSAEWWNLGGSIF